MAKPTRNRTIRGLFSMLLACSLLAIMGSCVFAVTLLDTPTEAPVVSFVRVAVNLLIVSWPALGKAQLRPLLGDLRPSLWLRGLFGGVSLMLSFAAIQRIGPGESAFLTASSGLFVAALSPWVLSQRNRLFDWLAIIGSMVGLYLLFQPGQTPADMTGRWMGIGSGILAALAYLMVARAGRSNSPRTVVFYFSFVATLLHGIWFAWQRPVWPGDEIAWGLILFAGIAGSIAQYCLTRAYQLAPATLVSAVAYLAPVMSMGLGIVLFGKAPDLLALTGCGLIVVCGGLLPFLNAVKRRAC